jgi:phage regulator Rha-like protein
MPLSIPAPAAAIAGNRRITAPARRLPAAVELIGQRIFVVRNQKVMLDSGLAELYRVETKALNRAVKRNPTRFPADFMFQITEEQAQTLRCQIGTSNETRGGRRYLPYAFTEHGVAMLSSVLNSERAVQMNILIVRAFVNLREVVATHRELARKMERMEYTQKNHGAVLAIMVKDVEDLEKKVKRGIRELREPRRRKPRMGFIAPPR